MMKEPVNYKPLASLTSGFNFISTLAQIGGVAEIARDAHDYSVSEGYIGLHAGIGIMLYASGSLFKWGVESVTRGINARYHSALERKLAEIMVKEEE
ncbi:hypothetical protein HYT55_00400 [Candidatus Woesearchaeota archaeon]|nr:hypothetical protein [Candidatus Woesearchaeota archaeon]